MENPLLDFSGLPRFDDIESHHVEPALDTLLTENRAMISRLALVSTQASWTNFADPFFDISEKLDRLWAVVSHINAVSDSPEFRLAYEASLKKWTIYHAEISQNHDLYVGFKSIEESDELSTLDPAKRKIVTNAVRDFKLNGVDLQGDARKRFAEISTELASLSNHFEQNLLDATDGWYMDLKDESDLAGLPDSAKALAKQSAELADVDGWRFTLHGPAYVPFMMFSERRDLRRQMYHAYITRASEIGPNASNWDNSMVMDQILSLRLEQSMLLGYENYSDYALVTRMADSFSAVEKFLSDLLQRTKPQAKIEYEELLDFASEKTGAIDINAWDLPYWSEKLRQTRHQFSQEEVRPFFPLSRVLEGMFEIAKRLFGIVIQVASSRPQMWHRDAMFFEIFDAAQEMRGSFYLDLYARPNKRGGAWMGDCIGRYKKANGDYQRPVAFLTCNFMPPLDDKPCLLTHDDVLTLFHEFGHGLHHLLTEVDEPGVSGINGVPWDAVELPSQFLENWCWEGAGLELISGHFETGERLPTHLLEKLQSARNFQSGLQMLRQLEFSVFDLRMHSSGVKNDCSIQQVLDNVRREVSVVQPPSFNRFQHSFSHIFAGGYAAGYYSYKWAEVLSADAFSRFEEQGLFDYASGRAFLHEILEKGGVTAPMSMLVSFLGRKPSVDTLLRHLGIDG